MDPKEDVNSKALSPVLEMVNDSTCMGGVSVCTFTAALKDVGVTSIVAGSKTVNVTGIFIGEFTSSLLSTIIVASYSPASSILESNFTSTVAEDPIGTTPALGETDKKNASGSPSVTSRLSISIVEPSTSIDE